MSTTNVWLFDFMSVSPSGRELCEILSFGKFAGSQIRDKITITYKAIDSPSIDESSLSKIVATESGIVFLILSKDRLRAAKRSLQDLKGRACSTLIVTDAVDPSQMVEMLSLGAADFITPPLKSWDIIPRLWRLLGRNGRESALLDSIKEKVGLQRLIGESRVFRDVVDKIPRLARCNASRTTHRCAGNQGCAAPGERRAEKRRPQERIGD